MEEKYLGGFTAGYLKRGWKAGGYGIYASNLRIFGIRPPMGFLGLLVNVALVAILGGLAVMFLVSLVLTGSLTAAPALTRYGLIVGLALGGALLVWGQRRLGFQSPKSLEELESRKEFEIERGDISSIELREPGVLRQGHLIIEPKTGSQVKVMIRMPKEYLQVKELMEKFCIETPPVQLRYVQE